MVGSLSSEDPLEKELAINPLQYSCLENPMGRGAWRAAVHGVTKSQTRLRFSLFKEPHVANSYHIGQCRYTCVHHHRKFCCRGLFLLSGVRSRNFNESSFLPHLYQPVTKACSSPHFGLLRMIESCNNDPQYCVCSDMFLKSPQSFKLKEARYI